MSSQRSLLDILSNENESFDNRLRIAACKFTSIDANIVRNREIILDWFRCRISDENCDVTVRKSILIRLKYCIATLTDILLSPQLADPILEILLQQSDRSEKELLQCSKEILKNKHFLKYFVNRMEKFAAVVVRSVRLIEIADNFMDDDDNPCDVILSSILFIKNHSFQHDELKSVFVESLIEPLSEMASLNTNESLPFPEVFYQVLFSNAHFRKTFVANILNADGDGLVFDVITTIRNYPTRLQAGILRRAYSLIFQGILASNADSNAKFRVFVALNSFIYMRPVPLGDESPQCVMFNENIHTCNELLELLLSSDISLDSVTQSITLTDWLNALINVILSEIKNNFSPPVVVMLKNALSFSPILMENCLRKFTKNAMLLKKTDPLVVQKYSELCLYFLNVHVKLNRMQKLISALLMSLKENLNAFRPEELPDKFDVLPEEIFEQVQSAVTNLPSTVQNVALLNTLLYHLENDCIAVLEKQEINEIDTKLVLLFDLVSYLISRFISGTRIMDYSVPEIVKEKFISLMDNLGALLGRYGKVIISKKHDPNLVECFLHLCSVWGDMQLVFMTYESAPRKVTKQVGITGNAATNLVYVHPYLTDYHWNLIAQRVANFGNENCARQLNVLVLQKIHALRFVEDEVEGPFLENVYGDGPAVVCAMHLANQADTKWIFHHVSEFAHLLKPVDVLNLSKVLVKYCASCEEDELSKVLSSDFREVKSLVLAMTHCTFHNLSKSLMKCNSKELKRILRRLNYVQMVEVEMEEGDDDMRASLQTNLKEIGELLSSDFVYAENTDDASISSIEKDVSILLNLPAQFLCSENKSMVCLLTICLIKSLIQLRRDDDAQKSILENLAKFLQSMLSDVTLPDSLDCGKILVWFFSGLKNCVCCDATMRRLCEAQPNYGSGVDTVIEMVKAAVGGQSPSETFIQSCNEGIDLVASYLINFQKARKRKNDNTAQEVLPKLMKLCYATFDQIFEPAAMEGNDRQKQLALYTLLLSEALQSGNTKQVLQLSLHLNKFITYMEEDCDSTSEEVSKFLFTILCHFKELKSYLPDSFILDAWECLWYVSKDEVIKALLRRASVQEYGEMIDFLLAHTEGSLRECEVSQSTELGRVWKLVLNTSVKLKKTKIQKRAVSELRGLVQEFAITNECAQRDPMCRMFIQIFTTVLQNTEIALSYQTADLCFDLISSSANENLSDELLIECVELLFVFCLIWKSMLLDRIPSFYLCYKSLFTVIVRRAEHTKCQNVEAISRAIHKLEKLTDNLVKSRKDFTKTAISAVGDLVNVVVEVKVDTKVENHLKNIIYCWIGMCDPHGLQFLSTAMSPAAQNLLKVYQSEYKKYYKFTGKV